MVKSTPSFFRLPQLQFSFTLTYHENGDAVAAASDAWFANGFSNFTEDGRRRLNGLKAGQLTAYCYNKTSEDRLRVVCDFMNFVFHLDDLCDNLKIKGTVILADLVMNAFKSPYSYRCILEDGRELPKEEPAVSKLAREYVFLLFQDNNGNTYDVPHLASGVAASNTQDLECKPDTTRICIYSLNRWNVRPALARLASCSTSTLTWSIVGITVAANLGSTFSNIPLALISPTL